MGALRIVLRGNTTLALLMVVVALAFKALVPSGYVLGSNGSVLTVQICADASGAARTMQVVISHTGKSSDGKTDHGKGDGTCPLSALSTGAVKAADPALLALALAFILLFGFAPVRIPAPAAQFHLRPPLLGPPAFT